MPPSDAALGLRERKNRRTRRAIVQAAAELTIQGGYAAATIPRIAERADVAPRTVSSWFPAKDDILFDRVDDTIARATRESSLMPRMRTVCGPSASLSAAAVWAREALAKRRPTR